MFATVVTINLIYWIFLRNVELINVGNIFVFTNPEYNNVKCAIQVRKYLHNGDFIEQIVLYYKIIEKRCEKCVKNLKRAYDIPFF